MKKILPALALFFAIVSYLSAAEVPKIAPKDAAKLVAEGKAVLVDCREASEWADTGVAAPATLLPKSDFDGDKKLWKEFLAKNKGKQVILYCRSGGRAGTVAAALNEQGVTASNAGGFKDWTAAGLPTRKADEKK
jgi:rhodanese-related sulfurtransferase